MCNKLNKITGLMSGDNSDRDEKKIVGRFVGKTPDEMHAAGKTNGGMSLIQPAQPGRKQQ
jgi:hypothetical protein